LQASLIMYCIACCRSHKTWDDILVKFWVGVHISRGTVCWFD